jgi:cation:H+ antiporter
MTIQTITLLFVVGLVLLIVGAEALVRGAARLAVAVGISPLVVGMTVVAYGTSAPELAVALQSVFSTPARPDLAVGNVVGSNISNILLVLGIAALAAPLMVARSLVRITVPLMILVAGVVWIMSLNGRIDRWEGVLLFGGSLLFTIISVARSRHATAATLAERHQVGVPLSKNKRIVTTLLNLALIVIGLVLLVFGARALVNAASEVARLLEINELVVGLTVVAVGTSLPEIATSVIAGLRGQRDIAVGNVVGSNIFNILLVLGLCAALAPQPVLVDDNALRFDIPFMFLVSFACWPIFYTQGEIDRWEGLALLGFYVAYTVFLYLRATEDSWFTPYLSVMAGGVLPGMLLLLAIASYRHWRRTRSP